MEPFDLRTPNWARGMERAAAEAAHMSAPDHGPHRSRRFLLLRKGRPHMSQSLEMVMKLAGWGQTFRGEPSLKTALIRPFLGLLTNFATGPIEPSRARSVCGF